MAGKYHPMDWVRVLESHTEYEWLVQRCLAIVDPWGDDRADLRAQVNTMESVRGSAEDRQATANYLTGYLKINQRVEPTAGPAAAKAFLES